jgi:hypothetical protein
MESTGGTLIILPIVKPTFLARLPGACSFWGQTINNLALEALAGVPAHGIMASVKDG